MLDNAERLFEGQLHGPETLLIRNNEIYTTIHGGEVIKITGDHITHVAKFGKPCGKFNLNLNFILLIMILLLLLLLLNEFSLNYLLFTFFKMYFLKCHLNTQKTKI